MERFCKAGLCALAWIFLCGFGGPAHEGSRRHMEGDYQGALELYKEAQESDAENKALDYNMGGAYHELSSYQEAAKAYDRAAGAEDPSISQSALFNRGVSLYRAGETLEKMGKPGEAQQLYSKSADGYKELLKMNPDDNGSRHNLELALAKVKKMEDQKQKQRQDKESQEKEDQDNKEQKSGGGQDDKNDMDSANDQDKKPEDQKSRQADKEENQPKPREITPEEARMTLNAIENDEKQLKKELRKRMAPQAERPEKDW